ncbi:MAG: DUF3995 domain-containing protein [Rhizobiaceae bacterium]|nr:DUF3995 domain-containing protein [Rhizobiaceae bacterium]MCV0405141.1 DUF3995 domain-containing protein [Rhizobiaceae bacterium]
MSMVGSALAAVLAALASIHLYWAAGGVWPGTDQKSCARAVAGFRGIDRMPPPSAAVAVAFVLFVAAGLALALSGGPGSALPASLLLLLGVGAAIVFLGRGIAGFTPAWRRLTPEMPFARNDVRWFSPLCLGIGAGFALLTIRGTFA